MKTLENMFITEVYNFGRVDKKALSVIGPDYKKDRELYYKTVAKLTVEPNIIEEMLDIRVAQTKLGGYKGIRLAHSSDYIYGDEQRKEIINIINNDREKYFKNIGVSKEKEYISSSDFKEIVDDLLIYLESKINFEK